MLSARSLRRLAFVTLQFAAAELASPAQAAPTDDELRAARELFVQAEHDEDAENWQAALEKLSRVSQVRLTAGVRYHVALCHEHLGRLATALQAYLNAQDQAAETEALDVVRLAATELTSLIPRVPRLAIQVAPDVPDAVVRLDGVRVEHARLGGAFPIDPGLHDVEASAKGRSPTKVTLSVQEGDVTFLRISFLPTGVASGTPPATEPAVAEHASAHPVPPGALAFTAAAAGLAALGVGAYFLAGNAHADAVSRCRQMTSPCDGEKGPVHAWDWAALGVWGGAAVSGAVAAFFWTGLSGEGPAKAARIVAGPGTLGVAGSF